MLPSDRKRKIVELVTEMDGCSVDTLAEQLDYSPSTIRRDLNQLDDEELIERTHGGATPSIFGKELRYDQRRVQRIEQKSKIGERAAEEIHDGQAVFFDSGTTTKQVAEHAPENGSFVGVSNSPVAVFELAKKGWELKLTGGAYRPETEALVGPQAEKYIDSMNFDLAFIGATGIDISIGVMCASEAEAEIKRSMLANTKRVVLVADASKFDEQSFMKFGSLEDIDMLITDTKVDSELEVALKSGDVTVVDGLE